MDLFYVKSKLMTGDRALSNIPHELKMKNLSKPMLIAEKMESYAPFYKPIKEAFDNDKIKIPCIVTYTSEIAEIDIINEYIEKYKEAQCDSIIAVGREAVISVAKLVKLAIEQGAKDIKNITSIGENKTEVPLFVVSVFYGSGDEGKGVARCYDDKVAYDFVTTDITPDAVIVDSSMIYSPSRSIMASSVMYSLATAVIAYTNKTSNMMTRTTAMATIRLLCNALNDKDFLKKMSTYANDIATSTVISGMASNNIRQDDLAIMSSIVSKRIKVPFSKVYSMLFPHYYEMILDKDDIFYMEVLLPIIGEERYVLTPVNKRAEEVYYEIRGLINWLQDHTGFRYNLSDYGMRRADIPSIVREISAKGVDSELTKIVLERTY